MRTLTREEARRVAVRAAGLAGGHSSVLGVVEGLGDLQLDPTRAVERTQLLVLWSRLGRFPPAELDRLIWKDRRLFELSAFVYPVRDLALHAARMRGYPSDVVLGPTRATKIREWLDANVEAVRYVLAELRRRGPLLSRDLDDRTTVPWRTGGWNDGKNLPMLLECLWGRGDILVSSREGGERVWDLAERVLPQLADVEPLEPWEGLRGLVLVRMRAAGVGRPTSWHRRAARELAERGELERVAIEGVTGEWYAHPAALADRGWEQRVTLLSPFDPLIRDRERTLALWDFDFRLEIYVPKAKRRYGYFVMPVLDGDELVGRIDPLVDRERGRLVVNAVHPEPGRTLRLDEPLASLAEFVGAGAIDVPSTMAAWTSRRARSTPAKSPTAPPAPSRRRST
jgi:uncharacterized protein